MSNSAMVISSDNITSDELSKFLLGLGGCLVPLETQSYVINDSDSDLWIAIQDKSFSDDFYDDETLSSWNMLLGKNNRTIIELQLDHSAVCKQLYLYIAYEMGKRWNIVLDDIDDAVVSYSALATRYINNNDKLTIDKKYKG